MERNINHSNNSSNRRQLFPYRNPYARRVAELIQPGQPFTSNLGNQWLRRAATTQQLREALQAEQIQQQQPLDNSQNQEPHVDVGIHNIERNFLLPNIHPALILASQNAIPVGESMEGSQVEDPVIKHPDSPTMNQPSGSSSVADSSEEKDKNVEGAKEDERTENGERKRSREEDDLSEDLPNSQHPADFLNSQNSKEASDNSSESEDSNNGNNINDEDDEDEFVSEGEYHRRKEERKRARERTHNDESDCFIIDDTKENDEPEGGDIDSEDDNVDADEDYVPEEDSYLRVNLEKAKQSDLSELLKQLDDDPKINECIDKRGKNKYTKWELKLAHGLKTSQ